EIPEETAVAQVAEDLAQRRDAVARIDPVAVIERGRISSLRIVIQVHHVQGGAVDLLQRWERSSTLIEVKDVQEEAGIGAASGDGHVDTVRQRTKNGMRAPQFEQRLYTHLLAHLQRVAIIPCGII